MQQAPPSSLWPICIE